MADATNPFGLDGELALITGGGTGLGRGIARCMLAAGARVVLVGRREEVLKDTCLELGGGSRYYLHDVTDMDAAPALLDQIRKELGTPTILVNNAGVHLKKASMDVKESEFLHVLNTHLVGAMAMSRAAGPHMVEAGRGSILFITSMAAIFGLPHTVAYSAAKSALLGVVRTLAVELSPQGVRVNAIAPGWVETPMLREALDGDPERSRRILARTPMNRFGDPADVGQAAVYLCSEAGRFVTGHQLVVDGGASIGF